jgi:hypothetical protein
VENRHNKILDCVISIFFRDRRALSSLAADPDPAVSQAALEASDFLSGEHETWPGIQASLRDAAEAARTKK